MTTVVITGAAGQVGRELVAARWPASTKVVPLARSDLDIRDASAVAATIADLEPDVIVNAAAFTGVDAAEDDERTAHAVNCDGVRHLARAAGPTQARLVHLSTDYVFDGAKDGWYVESDPVAPLGVYGRTKAAGEQAAQSTGRHVILRTAWVYSAHEPNFVTTMRRLGEERDHLAVVNDQIGCPTAAGDIASAIAAIVCDHVDLVGTYHLASPTASTWYEFAREILADRIESGLIVEPITTDQYPTRAARPRNSRLDSSKLADRGVAVRSWQDALPDVLAQMEGRR